MIPGTDERGRPMKGDTLLLLFNSHHEPLPFRLPKPREGQAWDLLFDTSHEDEPKVPETAVSPYALQPRSMVVFRTVTRRGAAAKSGTVAPVTR
jgi:glycogen operon protein